jgi:thiosulfate dehydrogenase (quinone) large subunit
MESKGLRTTLGITRIIMGLLFLWPFFDKLIGLGFNTEPGGGWIFGNSPTVGFLVFGARGPFAPLFNAIGGIFIVDLLYMLGLLFVGAALVLGIVMKIAAISGSVMMFMMWMAQLPKEMNLFQIDYHIVYILVLLILMFARAGNYGGLGRRWSSTSLGRRNTWLQ